MKVDFIPETEPKLAAADLNGLTAKQFISIFTKISATLLMDLFAKIQALPPEPDEDSE